jgi:hypothetical protein
VSTGAAKPLRALLNGRVTRTERVRMIGAQW